MSFILSLISNLGVDRRSDHVTVQGAVATWSLPYARLAGRQVATAPSTVPADKKIGDRKIAHFSVPYFFVGAFQRPRRRSALRSSILNPRSCGAGLSDLHRRFLLDLDAVAR